jgi:hypothetical protein
MQDSSLASPSRPIEVQEPDLADCSVPSRVDRSYDAVATPDPTISAGAGCRPGESVDPPHRNRSATMRRCLKPLHLTAGTLLVICVTGFTGWLATELIHDRSAREALVEYVVTAAGRAQKPEFTAPAIATDPAIWASGRSGMGRSEVDLSTSGFRLRSASIAPASDVLTTLLVYVNAEGRALALTVRPDAGTAHASITQEVRAHVTVFTWVDNGISYKLVSDMPTGILFMIAVEVHKQTCHHRTDLRLHAIRDVARGRVEKVAECQPALKIVGKL